MKSTLAIVTRTSDYRDNDKMVSLFSQDYGRIDALARGAKKPTSNLGAVVKPFVCAEFSFTIAKERYYITHGIIKESFFGLSQDMKAYAAASTILEICGKSVMPGEQNKRLFSLLINALYAMNQNNERADEIFAFFIIKFLDAIGMRPDMEHCVSCGSASPVAFDSYKIGAVCDSCITQNTGYYYSEIKEILQMRSKDILQTRLHVDKNFAKFCMKLIQNVLECRLKSMEIYKTML